VQLFFEKVGFEGILLFPQIVLIGAIRTLTGGISGRVGSEMYVGDEGPGGPWI